MAAIPDIALQLLLERPRLDMARAACLLAGAELFRSQTVDAVRSFASVGTASDEAVGGLDDALDWLIAGEAIGDRDADEIRSLVALADEASAALVERLVAGTNWLPQLEATQRILTRLGRFWGRVDIDTNPDFDGQDIDDADVVSGSAAMFDVLLASVATA